MKLKKKLIQKGYFFKTTSDTEILLHSYFEWGEKCLSKLEGMFSFCIYNKKTNEIFAAKDSFGIKPLFYYKDKNNFIIASEKKAIFEFGIKKEPNKKVISNYIAHGVYQNNDNTFYKNIYSLKPGTFLKIKKLKFNFYKWFDIELKNLNKIKYKDAKNELNYLIKNSIKLCLRSDKKIAVATSGGLDSSVILSKMFEFKVDSIVKYFVHWSCGDEHDEKFFAKKIAQTFNKNILISNFKKNDFYKYLSKCLTSIEEPFGGLNVMSSTKTYENLNKKKIRVLIDGNGADEILGGYQHHIDAHNRNYLDYTIQPVQGLKIKFFTDILNKNCKKLISKFNVEKKFSNPLKDSMYNDLMGSKLRRSLYQSDHNTMSNSIETRFPFLNKDLVNFCYSLPNEYLVNKNIGKYILRDTVNKKFSWSHKRPNQTPQTKWMRNFIIENLCNNLKKDNNFFDLNIFNREILIKRLNNSKKNVLDNSVFPWQILMIYNFLKQQI